MTIDQVLSKDDKDNLVKQEFERFICGEKSPLEAARSIQSIIGAINGYKYKNGSLSIDNCRDRYSVPLHGGGRAYDAKVEEFKAALRIVARGNGRTKIEDHLAKGCSTRHYAEEFWEYARNQERRVLVKYGS